VKIIQVVTDHINDELEDACAYAELAIEHKAEYRSLAETFYSLSNDEMKHSMALHNEVVKLIEDYRREHGDPPENMMAVYDYLHKKSIEKAEKVKRYQQLYSQM